jgi:hypothetical protein
LTHLIRAQQFSLLCSIALTLFATAATVAAGADFRVNSEEDFPHWHQGNGICEVAPGDTRCTLRAAIMEANVHPGEDRIVIPAGTYALSFKGNADETAGAVGDLDVSDDLLIEGAGVAVTTLDGLGFDRVLDIHGARVTVTGLSIQNGDSTKDAEQGGAIRNSGTLSLIRVHISDSQGAVDSKCATPTEGSGTPSGCDAARATGAISNTGSLTLAEVTVNGQLVNTQGAEE